MPTVINKGRTSNSMQSIGEISPVPNQEQVLNVGDRPVKETSGSYSFVEQDRGKYLVFSDNITLDAGIFPANSELIFKNTGGADLSLISGSGVSVFPTDAGAVSPITIPNGYTGVLKHFDGTDTWLFNMYGYSAGASGSFTTVDLKTVTVVNGLITSIV